MQSSRIREKVKKDYDFIAREFDASRHSPWADFKYFDPFYRENARVLDLGCGNGRLLKSVKDFKSYLAVDQSKELLKFVPKLKGVEVLEDDIFDLKKLKGSYDFIFAIASFHHLPREDQLLALKRWYELLEPGGYLFMTNWNLHQFRYLTLLLKSVFWGFRNVRVPWKKKVQRFYFAFTKRRLRRLLEEAGFKVLENKYVKKGEASGLFFAHNIVTIARK